MKGLVQSGGRPLPDCHHVISQFLAVCLVTLIVTRLGKMTERSLGYDLYTLDFMYFGNPFLTVTLCDLYTLFQLKETMKLSQVVA